LMRFVNGVDGGCDFVDFIPRIADSHTLQGFVFRARKCAAPLGNLRLRKQGC
jgi:hypothetical protein